MLNKGTGCSTLCCNLSLCLCCNLLLCLVLQASEHSFLTWVLGAEPSFPSNCTFQTSMESRSHAAACRARTAPPLQPPVRSMGSEPICLSAASGQPSQLGALDGSSPQGMLAYLSSHCVCTWSLRASPPGMSVFVKCALWPRYFLLHGIPSPCFHASGHATLGLSFCCVIQTKNYH